MIQVDIEVHQLATSQINTGHYLQPNSRTVKPGDYSFDLNINNLTYEFQFNVDEEESNSDIQNKLARLINRSNIGLNASVSEDSLGNTALNIESDMTGVSVIKPTIFNISLITIFRQTILISWKVLMSLLWRRTLTSLKHMVLTV